VLAVLHAHAAVGGRARGRAVQGDVLHRGPGAGAGLVGVGGVGPASRPSPSPTRTRTGAGRGAGGRGAETAARSVQNVRKAAGHRPEIVAIRMAYVLAAEKLARVGVAVLVGVGKTAAHLLEGLLAVLLHAVGLHLHLLVPASTHACALTSVATVHARPPRIPRALRPAPRLFHTRCRQADTNTHMVLRSLSSRHVEHFMLMPLAVEGISTAGGGGGGASPAWHMCSWFGPQPSPTFTSKVHHDAQGPVPAVASGAALKQVSGKTLERKGKAAGQHMRLALLPGHPSPTLMSCVHHEPQGPVPASANCCCEKQVSVKTLERKGKSAGQHMRWALLPGHPSPTLMSCVHHEPQGPVPAVAYSSSE